jgi:adenosine deaminase
MKDYDIHMKMIAFLKTLYPNTQITLHAGELTPKLVDFKKGHDHIRKAIEIAGAKRIGHGVNVLEDLNLNQLLQTMSERKIMVEVNLSSNDFILGVRGKNHPLRVYLDHNVPTSLSTDDEGVLRTTITLEFLKAIQEHDLSYNEVKGMVRNSLQHSFLEESKKNIFLNRLNIDFDKFERIYCK